MHQRVRKEFWGYAPDEALAPMSSSSNNMRHPPGAGYPRSLITPRRRRCSACSMRRTPPA